MSITEELVNPLKAELYPICHLLVLLGDLTFMGPCIVSVFQYTSISNKMQRYTVYLYLETGPHVSGGTSTCFKRQNLLILVRNRRSSLNEAKTSIALCYFSSGVFGNFIQMCHAWF